MRPNSFRQQQNAVATPTTTPTCSSPSSSSSSIQFAQQQFVHRHTSPFPPAVVLLPEGSGTPAREVSEPRLMRNPSMEVHSPVADSLGGFFTGHLQRPQSRSPSASSLNAPGSRHTSPNPSPPPSASGSFSVTKISSRSSGGIGPTGATSVARMMSALLKQQNSIAEEEDTLLWEECPGHGKTTAMANGTPPSIGTPPTSNATESLDMFNRQNQHQQNWLVPPPDHVLLAGNISPPPARIHPISDQELRKEIVRDQQNGTVQLVRNWVGMATSVAAGPASPAGVHPIQKCHQREEKFVRQQSQPTWTRGANSKHRKGSLSPNNSLRYSTLMAAARRNHFQQQRTTSEATPGQRDQLMADVLGHGIRDKFCASVSAPSPQLAQEGHDGSGSSSALRFELGGGDSSISSLNQPSSANATPSSQCSSANSLFHHHHRVNSIRQRPQTVAQRSRAPTGESSGAGGSLPKLVALVPPAFPPASVMLSSETLNGESKDPAQSGRRDSTKRRRSRADGEQGQRSNACWNSNMPKQPQDMNKEANSQQRMLYPPDLQLPRDPSRWNLAATKQRSISESAFNMNRINMHKCCHCQACISSTDPSADELPHRCVHLSRLADPSSVRAVSLAVAGSGEAGGGSPRCPLDSIRANGALRRPDSLSALGACKHSVAFLAHSPLMNCYGNNQQREQAILQRILGPAGLGWLKQRRFEAGDTLLKKSLSLVLPDDVEAQRPGAVSAGVGGGGGDRGGGGGMVGGGEKGSLLNDESNCSVKQPLMVKEKERERSGGRFIKRQQLFNKRRVTSDYALFFALFGIVLMIVENEFAYAGHYSLVCDLLKITILLSTVCLVALVVKFHVHEIQIFMNANSAEDWQIALTCRKTMQILVEIVACAICPLPVRMDVNVTTVNSDGHAVPMRMPLDVLFSILMFFRLYWLCRVMLLHSRLFTDAASRSIAGLNRVKTDAKFILKTLMTICPGTMLMLFTASLWMIGGYILRLCERHHELLDGEEDPLLVSTMSMQANKHRSYLNSLWLIAVTFLSIGYGDIVPNTQCGRIMAVVTGILGTCTSSMVVAVIARKLELTRAEKHVHNFMIETQHTKELKHIAANVLRETWLIYKYRRLVDKIDPSRIRHHQRKFLVAICALRKLKTSQRKLDENRISLGDVAKTTSHSHELMREVHSTQEGLALRITAVEHQLSDIQREMGNISEMLRYALRGPMECSGGQQSPSPMADPVRHRRKPSIMSDAPSC